MVLHSSGGGGGSIVAYVAGIGTHALPTTISGRGGMQLLGFLRWDATTRVVVALFRIRVLVVGLGFYLLFLCFNG